jgi:hypothetical protein
MQHAHKTDVSTEVLVIGSDLQECGCAGVEQKVIDDFLVGECEIGDLMRKREDHMHVGNIQQFRFAGSEPLVTGVGLALCAMAVTTRNGEIPITCLMESLF